MCALVTLKMFKPCEHTLTARALETFDLLFPRLGIWLVHGSVSFGWRCHDSNPSHAQTRMMTGVQRQRRNDVASFIIAVKMMIMLLTVVRWMGGESSDNRRAWGRGGGGGCCCRQVRGGRGDSTLSFCQTEVSSLLAGKQSGDLHHKTSKDGSYQFFKLY